MIAAGAGCAGDVVVLELPAGASTARSFLVGRVDAEHQVVVEAAEVEDGVVRFEAPPRALDLELRTYDVALSELGLAPGPVAPVAVGVGLPPGRHRYTARIEGEQRTAWTESVGLPELTSFQRANPSPCLTLTADEIGTLPTSVGIRWALSVSPTQVLMGGDTTAAILFEAGVAPRRLSFRAAGDLGTPLPRSAFLDEHGGIWLGDQDGGLWQATIGDTTLDLTRVVGPTPHGPALALDGDPSNPYGQLFTVTTSGTVAQLDGDAWRTLETVPLNRGQDPVMHAIWLAPDEVVFASSSWPTVRHRQPGGVVVETDLVDDGEFGVTALTEVGPRTLAAGLAGGRAARWVDGQWAQLGKGGFALDIKVFYPLADGFLYAGVFGYVGQWREDLGFCPGGDMPLAGATVELVLPLGQRLLMIGDAPRGPGDTAYTLVSLR